jgi:ubiquinone/menaquinone biosynthesis C-methylase UbiE
MDSSGAIEARFNREVAAWEEIYDPSMHRDAFGRITRYRANLVRQWVRDLGLRRGAAVLDAGCGTGRLAFELAQQDFKVAGVDRAFGMAHATDRRGRAAVAEHTLVAAQADVRQLPFADAEFDLSIGLGLLMWLERPLEGVRELARVTRRRGYVLVHAINATRIDYAVDPWLQPDHGTLSAQQLGSLLHQVDLVSVRQATYGYGPFTVAGHAVLPARAGGMLQIALQVLADRALPSLRAVGGHHLVLARRR